MPKKTKLDYNALSNELMNQSNKKNKKTKKIKLKKEVVIPKKTMNKNFVHVGWYVINSDLIDEKTDLPQFVKDKIRDDYKHSVYITCVEHISTNYLITKKKDDMKSNYDWYMKNKNREMNAIVNGYYCVGSGNNELVLDCSINSKKCLFNLFIKSKIKPFELKKKVLNGDYGDMLKLERKRHIKVRAYAKPELEKNFVLAS